MNKDQFKKSLIGLFVKSRDIFNEMYKNRPPFGMTKEVYTIENKGTISRRGDEIIDLHISLSLIEEQLVKIDEFKKFRNLLLEDEEIKSSINCMVGFGRGLLRYTDNQLILRILQILFETSENEWQAKIERIYDNISTFYMNKKVENKGRVFLENVSLNALTGQIDKDIIIRGLSQEDIVKLLNSDRIFEKRYGFGPYHPMRDATSLVEFHFEEKRICVPYEETKNFIYDSEKDYDVINRVFRFLDSLRILSDSTISTSPVYTYHKYTPFDEAIEPTMLPESPTRLYPYITLTEDDLKNLREFYLILSKLKVTIIEQISLNRLEKFGVRDTIEDKILDLFVGFEAIVLGGICKKSDVQGELRFRLSLLTAKYIGSSEDEQQNIFKLLKKGYDLRSSIIHGSEINKHSSKTLLDDLTKIYKRLIYKWIEDKSCNKNISPETLLFK